MRIIVLFFTLFHIGFTFAFVPEINLSADSSRVGVGESFNIIIDVFPEHYSEELAIDTIGGIENFTFLAQSKSQRYVSVNGNAESKTELYITLIGKQQGDFTLGPVDAEIGSINLRSNTIEVEVFDSSNQSSSPHKEPGTDDDILDIFESSGLKVSFNYTPFFIVLFFIMFSWLIHRYLKQQKKPGVITQVQVDSHEEIISKLKKLKAESGKQEKTIFYSEFNLIVREFFDSIGYKHTEKMTFREISKLGIKNKKIAQIFKKSYMREFDSSKGTLQQRKDIIDDFIQELKQ